jgi:GNAT superfamily N-acetyltransferase
MYQGREWVLRGLQPTDAEVLGDFLEGLSPETKQRFGPHPLTHEFAQWLCAHLPDHAARFVLHAEGDSDLAGYFILDRGDLWHEYQRYAEQGNPLPRATTAFFAPVLADSVQGLGLGRQVMPKLIGWARGQGLTHLALLGGTQATNARALAFYEHFGFRKCGGYQTEVFNFDMLLIIS